MCFLFMMQSAMNLFSGWGDCLPCSINMLMFLGQSPVIFMIWLKMFSYHSNESLVLQVRDRAWFVRLYRDIP